MTIPESFPAREALMDLVRTCSAAWKHERVDAALRCLPRRTREHLYRWRLLACPCHPEGAHQASMNYIEVEKQKRAAAEKRNA